MEGDEVYCICRSTDISRFMIGCDKCDEWYHGDCIDVSAEDAKVIKKYFCDNCRKKNPGLKIKYKRKYREQFMITQPPSANTGGSSSQKVSPVESTASDSKSSTTSPVATKPPKLSSVVVATKEQPKTDKTSETSSVASTKVSSERKKDNLMSEKSTAKNDSLLSFATTKFSEKKSSDKSSSKNSSVLASILSSTSKVENNSESRKEREAASSKEEKKWSEKPMVKERKIRPDDAILKDKPFKLGKSDAEKNLEKLLQAQLLKSSEKTKDDNSKQNRKGDSEKQTSSFAVMKIGKDAKKNSEVFSKNESSEADVISAVVEKKSNESVRDSKEKEKSSSSKGNNDEVVRMAESSLGSEMTSEKVQLKERSKDTLEPSLNDNHLRTNQDENIDYSHKRRKKRKYMDEDGHHGRGTVTSSQCLGPGCINRSRRTSKYCSDECGMNLARQRLLTLLPEKISDWQRNPPVANEKDQQELEKIRAQKAAVLTRVKELDIERQDLEREISSARLLQPLPEDDPESEESATGDIFCFTCGSSISQFTALKHIERCFAKIETQTSYESKYASNIPMLFCDFYNTRTTSFCKRLKIICPEHSAKDYKVGEYEVCGCPLPNPGEAFYDDKLPHEYCRVLKRKCLKHYKWEVMRIATIDAERVNNLIKYDELLESESRYETSLKTRGSVMDLILNTCQAH